MIMSRFGDTLYGLPVNVGIRVVMFGRLCIFTQSAYMGIYLLHTALPVCVDAHT